MSENSCVEQPIIDQIYARLLSNLEGKEGFDGQLLERIRQMASAGHLSKAARVEKVLKQPGEHYETA